MNRGSLMILSGVLALPLGAAVAAMPQASAMFAEARTAEGTIKSVDIAGNSFVLSTGIGNDKKDVTVKVTADTKYTLDGKNATRDTALVVGNHAKVTHTDNTASKVDAKSPKKPSGL
jgi:hypothetical protein